MGDGADCMRAEVSFVGITEAMPADMLVDMLVAAMGDRAERARVSVQALHIGGECCGCCSCEYW